MSFLINPFMSKAPIAITYLQNSNDTVNRTTYTFSSVNLGDAATDRVIIVGIGGTSGSSRSISSVTIGGVSATAAATANISWAIVNSIWYAAVPSGTTGDIVITFSAVMVQCVVNAFRMTGQTSNTPANTGTDTTGSTTSDPNINVTAGDVIVSNVVGGDGTAMAWTGTTEADDRVVDGHNFSAALHTAVTTESPRAIQAVSTSATNITGVSVAWR